MVTDEPLAYEEVLLPPSLFTQRRRQRLPFGDLLRRGWAFLRGDAYVHVFHDLRPQQTTTGEAPKRGVIFSPGGISITQLDGVDHHYRYPEIGPLQLNQYTFKQRRSDYATPYDCELTELVFGAREDNHRIYLPRTTNDFVRLWMSLERWGGFRLMPRDKQNTNHHRRGTMGTESYYRVVWAKTLTTPPTAVPPLVPTAPVATAAVPLPATRVFDFPLASRPGGALRARERLTITEKGLTLHHGERSKPLLPYGRLTQLHLNRHVIRRIEPLTEHLVDIRGYFELIYRTGGGQRILYLPTEIKDMGDLHYTLEKWTGHKFHLPIAEPAVTSRGVNGLTEHHALTEYHLRIAE